VVNKLLGTTWLWDRVRVVGGAYGGFSDFDSHSGMFTYLSYRDPNLMKTVENYDGTVDYLKSLEIGGDELTKAIIGTMGDIDAYQLPDAKGYTSLMRHLLKVSDEERQERREQILSTSQKDFRRVLYTGSHTTPFAWWTPILKDFSRCFSPPTPRFQSPTSTPFNSN